ncbi:ralBP1-associated Eps domain-containing protein 2 [Atheta coriaria]|uniref:ralBP1-associated Eps domain-containing protein 2 n=1 Tax=Dalotia coriaria TaxID=877792 RepID=UPI0031F3BEEA
MDTLFLPDPMQRYFYDFFQCCEEDKSGKVDVNKLLELIRSGNVPDETIDQIADICWSQSASYVNSKQFCSALKLVAAYQSNVPIRSEILSSSTVELTWPRFSKPHVEPQADLIELRNDDSVSTDSEVDSETLSVGRGGSPGASSTASDSPTPTNSVQDRSWAITSTWQGLVSEEQRQLLGTEEESSDRHSSEEDTEVSTEVWNITPEQREYYTTQFKSLQADTNALLAGSVARMFFEKSRLPVHELRKIWQLADVTKDGALSLQEFSAAMHLVVLRRNHIELPTTLPPQLQPTSASPASETPETEPILSPQTKESSKEWTKFVDSPTNSVSSPGPKPVNFDFHKGALEMDPKILHPVALRLTPEVLNDDEEASPKKSEDKTTSAIQRPQPKKFAVPGPGAIPPPPSDGPVSLPAFPPPKKEKPPPPPPRPFKTHGRSSSLDLNKLNKHLAPPTVPPRISPNVQHSTKKQLINQRSEDCHVKKDQTQFADFEQFEKYENVLDEIFPGDQYEAERKKLFAQFSVTPENASQDIADGPRRHGAFEIYRKPPKTRDSPMAAEDRARFDLFVKLQEQNTVLLRLCQELSQELVEIKEEKVALKLRLEKQVRGDARAHNTTPALAKNSK